MFHLHFLVPFLPSPFPDHASLSWLSTIRGSFFFAAFFYSFFSLFPVLSVLARTSSAATASSPRQLFAQSLIRTPLGPIRRPLGRLLYPRTAHSPDSAALSIDYLLAFNYCSPIRSLEPPVQHSFFCPSLFCSSSFFLQLII